MIFKKLLYFSISLLAITACSGNLSNNENKQRDTRVTTKEASDITVYTAMLSGTLEDAIKAPREVGFE